MINSGLETQKVLRTRPQAFLTGQETDIDWLQRVGYNNTLNAVVLAQWVNREIRDGRMPADSIMFLVGESKGDLLNARFMPDNGPEAYPWLAELVKAGGDPSRVIASFHERGINYVAINPAYLQWTLRYLDLRRDHQAFALATLREALYPYQDSVIRVATTFIFDLGRTPR